MTVTIHVGDALSVLRTLPAESVQCVITSPPYFGLRAYGTDPQVWGGDPEHGHEWGAEGRNSQRNRHAESGGHVDGGTRSLVAKLQLHPSTGAFCPCGAWRGELGSEPTPALFIEHLVSIFDEVKRVLRPDGLCFVNLGDSYSGSGKGPTGHNGIGDAFERQGFVGVGADARNGTAPIKQTGQTYGIPAKNLLLMPQRFAIAMQDRGWVVRSEIVWAKTSAMPESVRDRPTSAWEPIWMFSKSQRYFYDGGAVRQPHMPSTVAMVASNKNGKAGSAKGRDDPSAKQIAAAGGWADGPRVLDPRGASLRNVWTLGPSPFSESHFATFPPEIPRRCILAGTSEKGACPACGAPWVRVTERETLQDGRTPRIFYGPNGITGKVPRGPSDLAPRKVPETTTSTLGWQPGCSHCQVCDKLGLSADQGRIAHAAQRPGSGEGVAENLGEYTGAEGQEKRDAQSSSGGVPSLRGSVYGQEVPEALQPDMLSEMDVAERTTESATPLRDRAVQASEESGQARPRASRSDGGAPGTAVAPDRSSAPHQRGEGRQPDREPRRSDAPCPRQTPRETTAHDLIPYPPVPQLVCDPFGGSGTTGLVADRLGRDAILVELNPEYAEMARRRIEQDAGTLFGDPVEVEQPQQIDLFGEVS
jgi:DNA modification methylase